MKHAVFRYRLVYLQVNNISFYMHNQKETHLYLKYHRYTLCVYKWNKSSKSRQIPKIFVS